ncbi:hypothetical protein Dimus_007657, partial [Dionaea muscipula]
RVQPPKTTPIRSLIRDLGETKGGDSSRIPSDVAPLDPVCEDPRVVLVEVPVVTQGGGGSDGKERPSQGLSELDGSRGKEHVPCSAHTFLR